MLNQVHWLEGSMAPGKKRHNRIRMSSLETNAWVGGPASKTGSKRYSNLKEMKDYQTNHNAESSHQSERSYGQQSHMPLTEARQTCIFLTLDFLCYWQLSSFHSMSAHEGIVNTPRIKKSKNSVWTCGLGVGSSKNICVRTAVLDGQCGKE